MMKRYSYRQQGLTLVEMSVAMSVALTILIFAVNWYISVLERELIDKTVYRAKLVYEAAINYYINNDLDHWPATNNLIGTIVDQYMFNGAVETAWGDSFSSTVSGDNLQISFTLPDARLANIIVGKLPQARISPNNSEVMMTVISPTVWKSRAFCLKCNWNNVRCVDEEDGDHDYQGQCINGCLTEVRVSGDCSPDEYNTGGAANTTGYYW